MLKKISQERLFHADKGWLQSRYHFSFAEYMDRHNMHFGVLRVLNDDLIQPESGFAMHPHRDMEIVTYVIDGELSHKDSIGNEETLYRGEVQYMSAGEGLYHSEYNKNPARFLALLQIWILPPEKNLPTLYGSQRFTKEDRENKLLHMISSQDGNAPIKLYQDVNFYVSELQAGKSLEFTLESNRQIYFVQIEGSVTINSIELDERDALKIVDETVLEIKAVSNSHFLFIEMAKE